MQESQELTDALCTSVILAREYLKDVRIAPEQVGVVRMVPGQAGVLHRQGGSRR